MHRRASLHEICFPPASGVLDDIAACASLGFANIGLLAHKSAVCPSDQVAEALLTHGLGVSTLTTSPLVAAGPDDAATAAATASLRLALEVGAPTIYGVSGPADGAPWDVAAERFVRLGRPVAHQARAQGTPALIEMTLPLYPEVSFVHTLRDTLDLALQTGFGVVLDLFPVWQERGLEQSIVAGIAEIGLCQISDYVIGTKALPDRAVPGDGDVPLQRLIAAVLEAGYSGLFELELMGARVSAEGTMAAAARAGEWLSVTLDRLGA